MVAGENIKDIISQMERQFGEGALMLLGEEGPHQEVKVISSGSLALDRALGTGGLPKGRIVEIYGPESSGKTTMALHAVAQAQAEGNLCAFIDAEHALDIKYARNIGVDPNKLLISQPDCGEQALEITEALIRSEQVAVVVVDSVAALTPKAELDGDMGEAHVGLQARLMSQALRKLTAAAHQTNTLLIFINQIRQKIGVMFGNPETTTGGNALKFYATMRLDIRRIGALKEHEYVVGNRTRVKVVKNKLASPFAEAEFDILYGEGVSQLGEIADLAVEHNIIDKSGSWFSYQDRRLAQGREKLKEVLRSDEALRMELQQKIRELPFLERAA